MAALTTVATGGVTVALTGAAVALRDIPAAILLAAALAAALTGLWRFLHIGELLSSTRDFLEDWKGRPARPGHDAEPGIPERVAKVAADVHEVKGALPSAFDELMRQITDVRGDLAEVKDVADRTEALAVRTEGRVDDHKVRGLQAAQQLREEVERRAEELEAKLNARNEVVDARLDRMSVDRATLDAYRSALHEVGLPAEPQTPDAHPDL